MDSVVHQNVTPVDFEVLKQKFEQEGFEVISTGIDNFKAHLFKGLVKIEASLNRNMQTLELKYGTHDWLPQFSSYIENKIQQLTGKTDVSNLINHVPVRTEVNKQGQVSTPKPVENSTQEQAGKQEPVLISEEPKVPPTPVSSTPVVETSTPVETKPETTNTTENAETAKNPAPASNVVAPPIVTPVPASNSGS
jgi:hypothetical protein